MRADPSSSSPSILMAGVTPVGTARFRNHNAIGLSRFPIIADQRGDRRARANALLPSLNHSTELATATENNQSLSLKGAVPNAR